MRRTLLAALTLLTVVVRVAVAQELDSFKVYRVEEIAAEHVVSLQGQFDDQPKEVTLERLVSFANPVGIDGESIKDPQRHLTWYRFKRPTKEPLHVVEVENRFGQLRLTLGQPVFLLAPAEKKKPNSAAPTDLDHYQVYEVHQAKCVHRANRFVDLWDQFGGDEHVEVRFPRYFAVPVEKTVGGKRFPIKNAEDHLTIYEIRERNYSLGEWQAEDQFGVHELTIGRSELLCVPSRKREIAPPKGLDHFQIYDVTDVQVDHKLQLEGEFDRARVETQLHELTHLATATRKNDEDLVNEDACFTVYRIDQEQADPIRMVTAWNQFGEQQLWIGAPHVLLMPAKRKIGNAFADDLDYYVCYAVVRPCSFVPSRVTLDDRLGEPNTVTVTTPMLFCVPVEGGPAAINDEHNYLIIYRTSPQEESDVDELEVEDRFGMRKLALKRNTMLAVPTLKFEVFPPIPKDADAGR